MTLLNVKTTVSNGIYTCNEYKSFLLESIVLAQSLQRVVVIAQIHFIKKSGRAACRPIEGEEIPTYETFRFKIFRMSAIFVHSSTNGYKKTVRFTNI